MNQFLNPGTHFPSPFPFLLIQLHYHRSSQRAPSNTPCFYLLNSRTYNFFIIRGKIYSPSHPPHPVGSRWRQVMWVLILSYPNCYPSQLYVSFQSLWWHTDYKNNMKIPLGTQRKAPSFLVSPNTHTHTLTPLSLSLFLCCPFFLSFSLSLPPSIQ